MKSTKKELPTLEEFKHLDKEKKKIDNFEFLGHAQNSLAKEYGYKDYNAIKPSLSKEQQPQIITAEQMMNMIKEQIFSNNIARFKFNDENLFDNQKNIIEGIPIDPILPDDFDDTPNEERELIELNNWWNKPYILSYTPGEEKYKDYYNKLISYGYEVKEIESKEEFDKKSKQEILNHYKRWNSNTSYTVRILDGGAWDRSTNKGKFGNLEEALNLAKEISANFS